MIMMQFCCIFIFDDLMNRVLLVRKNKGPTPADPNRQMGLECTVFS